MRNSGLGLILLGLLLALLGFASVTLLVLALSHFYVAAYLSALAEFAGFLLSGGAFLTSYGPYLTRLEQWAPVDQVAREAEPRAYPTAEPAPTSVVVAIVTAAYGLIIACVGLFVMDTRALVFNLLAGGSLVLCAAAVWWMGREKR